MTSGGLLPSALLRSKPKRALHFQKVKNAYGVKVATAAASQKRSPSEVVLCVKFCKGGRGRAGLGGLAEVGFLVLLKIVHVEVAVGFEPVFVGLDG